MNFSEFYEIKPNGLIHQKKFYNKIMDYKKDYVEDRYNKYGVKGKVLAGIRLGFLLGSLNFIPKSILDVGYGNGDFLEIASQIIDNTNGSDISNYPLPEKVNFVNWDDVFKNNYDVITFFDSLEHFEDINFLNKLNCNYILITLPFCHNNNLKWFENWKHRRPDEHLWHFNKESMIKFFDEQGYEMVNCGIPFEDTIRKDERYNPNILTGVFKKKNIN